MTEGSADARLRELAQQGITPDAYGLLPAHADLVEELVARHGTLVLARRAVDLSLHRSRANSREDVAVALRELAARGVQPTARRLRQLGEDLIVRDAYRQFGSLRAAIAASGIAPVRSGPKPRRRSSEQVLSQLRSLDDTVRSLTADLVAAVDAYCERYLALVIQCGRDAVEVAAAARPSARVAAAFHPELVLDPSRVDAVLARVAASRKLTPRQVHVLAALVHGVPRNRISEVLGVSENTVKTFLQLLVRRLGVRNGDEAVWWVRQQVLSRTQPRRRA